MGLDLEYGGRSGNQDSDDLPNGVTGAFNPELGLKVEIDKIQWKVLSELKKAGEELWVHLKKIKEEKDPKRKGPVVMKRKRKKLRSRDEKPWG